MRLAFSSDYKYTAALSPCEQYILCPFRDASDIQLLNLRRVEAVKLGQAGFGLLSGHSCEQVEGEA